MSTTFQETVEESKAVEIDRGIPVAERRHVEVARNTALVATLKALGVGDSFLVSRLPEGAPRSFFCIRRWAKIVGVKIAIRLQEDGGQRVWRIE